MLFPNLVSRDDVRCLTRRGLIGGCAVTVAAQVSSANTDKASSNVAARLSSQPPLPGIGTLVDPDAESIEGPAQALRDALIGAGAGNSGWPTVALGRGNIDMGGVPLFVPSRETNLVGQGPIASRIFSRCRGAPALVSKNYAGSTRELGLSAGRSSDSVAEARSIKRNGLFFDWTGGHGEIRGVQVNNFNGFGIKLRNVWDALVSNLMVIDCGSDDEYALEVASSGDTSNHTLFSRIQVENAYGKAVLFGADNINLIVDGIHSEGARGNGSDYTHQFLGGFCSFRNARISNNGGKVRVRLGGGRNSYTDMWFQQGTIVDYHWGSHEPEFRSLIQNCVFDVLRITAANVGQVTIRDCFIRRLEVEEQTPGTIRLRDSDVSQIAIRGDPTALTR